jgi:hypothetical protein
MYLIVVPCPTVPAADRMMRHLSHMGWPVLHLHAEIRGEEYEAVAIECTQDDHAAAMSQVAIGMCVALAQKTFWLVAGGMDSNTAAVYESSTEKGQGDMQGLLLSVPDGVSMVTGDTLPDPAEANTMPSGPLAFRIVSTPPAPIGDPTRVGRRYATRKTSIITASGPTIVKG